MEDVSKRTDVDDLKLWLDIYPCEGEVKGGYVSLEHDLMVITS